MPDVLYKVDLPAFTGRNVPIKEIASAIGKDAQYVRLGLQQGILKFGSAIKVGNSNEYSYYCPDKRVLYLTSSCLTVLTAKQRSVTFTTITSRAIQ